MATTLTDAPVQQALNTDVTTSPGWVAWFKLVRLYLLGFVSNPSGDADLVTNTTFYATSSSLQTFTVPSRFNLNDTIQVIGVGSGGWKVQLGVDQTIVGGGTTTSGGSLSSANRYDTVTLKGSIESLQLSIVAKAGNPIFA